MSKVELQEEDENEIVDCHEDFGDCNANADIGCDDDYTKETNDEETAIVAVVVMHDEICDVVDYDANMTNYCNSQEEAVEFVENMDAEMEFVEENVDAEENDKVNEIFMVWSREEIKHYYGMMRTRLRRKCIC